MSNISVKCKKYLSNITLKIPIIVCTWVILATLSIYCVYVFNSLNLVKGVHRHKCEVTANTLLTTLTSDDITLSDKYCRNCGEVIGNDIYLLTQPHCADCGAKSRSDFCKKCGGTIQDSEYVAISDTFFGNVGFYRAFIVFYFLSIIFLIITIVKVLKILFD